MYVANDGKMFEDENECRAYEIKQKLDIVKSYCALYDCDGNKIDLNNYCADKFDTFGKLNDAYFIKVDTQTALGEIADLLYEYGMDTSGLDWDGKPDIFIYGDLCPCGYSGEWNSWNRTVEKLQTFKEYYIDKVKGDN